MGTPGTYIFRSCVPDGDISLANVQPGDVINRPYTFRVNEPPDIQTLLDNGTFDPRNVARGTDGELYDLDGNFLAEVNTWEARVAFRNTDYQPAGKKISWAIPQGYSVTLTLTETVVRDAILLQKVMAGLANGSADAVLNFRGVIKSRA